MRRLTPMKIKQQTICGENFITLENSSGLEVVLCEFGAGIYQIKLDDVPMIAGLKDYDSWLHCDAYHGKTIGRIAGRLGKAELHYQGKTYSLSPNEGKNTLHGGVKGFSFQRFSSHLSQEEKGARVDFFLISPDGDQGFPEELRLCVSYFLPENENLLRIEYEATSAKPTPASLTNHIYFNLGAHRNIEKDILYIDADESLHYDAELIPQGYEKTPSFLDFSQGKRIGEDLQNPALAVRGSYGIDHAFHKAKRNWNEPHVILENDEYRMVMTSSYDDVVIYTSNYGPFDKILSNGNQQELHYAIAVEPQYEALDFTRMSVTEKGQHNFIQYEFHKKGERL